MPTNFSKDKMHLLKLWWKVYIWQFIPKKQTNRSVILGIKEGKEKTEKAKILVINCICEFSSANSLKKKKGEFCMSNVQYKHHFTHFNFQNVSGQESATDILI